MMSGKSPHHREARTAKSNTKFAQKVTNSPKTFMNVTKKSVSRKKWGENSPQNTA